MSNPLPLLLMQATDPAEADRAWGKMLSWSLPFAPSQMQRQIDHAFALVRSEATCRNDPLRPLPHESGDGAPLGVDGLCVECGQPERPACACVLFERKGRHAKYCPRYES